MENVENIIELMKKRKIIHERQFMEMERKKINEYDDLVQELQTMKDERIENMETLGKNLESIIMHEYSIHKLIHNSEQVPGLPIPHDYHRQVITFVAEGIDFINKSQNVFKNLNIGDNNVNSANLISDITSCTSFIENELHIVESQIATVKALQKIADVGILLNSNNKYNSITKDIQEHEGTEDTEITAI